MSLRVAVVGGGPGGLFLATLLRRSSPDCTVSVFERNRADDTFGFGVVFSDRTLAGIHQADPVLLEGLEGHGVHWEDIEVRLKGERIRCGGNGMTAITRRTLLLLLQQRAGAMGAQLHFGHAAGLADVRDYDLVVAADGTGSTIREQLEPAFGSCVETARAKFIWFGTEYLFDALTFVHERGPHGVFAVHGYPISAAASTFIVETDEDTWRAAGLDRFDPQTPPGPSDLTTKAYLEELFAAQIDGASLLVNNSRWGNFRTRRTSRWHASGPGHPPVALLGDAAHTAHFSVGSGTKMAMEDAVALADSLARHPGDLPGALADFQAAAQPSVDAIQSAARPSLSWWEHFGRYHDAFEPWQFSYHFLSRSIGDARLSRRDPEFVAACHGDWRARHGAEPLDSPLTGPIPLPRRTGTVRTGADGTELLVTGAAPLALRTEPPVPGAAPWAAQLRAPADESGLPAARDDAARLVRAGAALVAVSEGTPLTRVLLSEHVRLTLGVPSLLVDPTADRDAALTTVLSGRADAVATAGERDGHGDTAR